MNQPAIAQISPATIVGDIVARDLRSAAVFAKHNIDFCCGGRRSLDEACQAQGVDPAVVIQALTDAGGPGERQDAASWPLDRLIDHIVTTHHAYVRAQLPLIEGYLQALSAKHGGRVPELLRVAQVFGDLSRELARHMNKEEGILFPFIRAMIEARNTCSRVARTPFGTIQNPVRMMEMEHQQAGDDMWLIRTLTDHYEPPPDACATWRACYAALADFERDLHEHVHLENNVLFPAATRLEEDLA